MTCFPPRKMTAKEYGGDQQRNACVVNFVGMCQVPVRQIPTVFRERWCQRPQARLLVQDCRRAPPRQGAGARLRPLTRRHPPIGLGQDALHRAPGAQILLFIQQGRVDGARRAVGEPRTFQDRAHLRPFVSAQCPRMGRRWWSRQQCGCLHRCLRYWQTPARVGERQGCQGTAVALLAPFGGPSSWSRSSRAAVNVLVMLYARNTD